MGRRSVKPNKNVYQLAREEQGLTRAKASEVFEGVISETRLERIENQNMTPYPDEVLMMSEKYRKPSIRHYYCVNECAIGKRHIPDVEAKELSQIVLEILVSLDAMEKKKKRFMEIVVDGKVEKDEQTDFVRIVDELNRISAAVNAMKLWIEEMAAVGKIDQNVFDRI